MPCFRQIRVRWFQSAAFILLMAPAIANAQSLEMQARSGFTGKQLFEHEWKWVGSKLLPIRRALMAKGTGVTRLQGVLGDGLGPLHNATSCAQCHVAGGASGVERNVTMITVDPRSAAVAKRTQDGRALLDVFPGLLDARGSLSFTTVVHDRSTRSGYAEIRNRLVSFVPGGIEDQWFDPGRRQSSAIAAQPVIAGRYRGVDFYLSQRNAPALFGLGSIDRINDARLRELAERQAAETNGEITGRFIGKFGWRGQINSLASFVSQACAGELGLSQGVVAERPANSKLTRPTLTVAQPADPADFEYVNLGVDMTLHEVDELTSYVSSLARPTEAPTDEYTYNDVLNGERLFGSVGCTNCHVPDLSHISGIFSDLLVHDMGPRLQAPDPAPVGEFPLEFPMISVPILDVRGPGLTLNDLTVRASTGYYGSGAATQRLPKPYPFGKPVEPRFPRGETPSPGEEDVFDLSWDAFQREWRTPPLWGVGDTAPYLHDGRAATLDEAILWHGGEAKSSRDRYSNLPQADKSLVLAFLSSLRAP